MSIANETFPINRKFAWLMLLLLTVAAFAIVVVPVWLIQPFKPQTARAVDVSYSLKRWAPWTTVFLLAATLFFAAYLWRRARWFKRILLLVVLVPVFAATWFARQNHFEWMFNPLAHAAYAKVNEADFVTGSDIVMTVDINGEAAAYPIRQMAYHHLVQDVVGGTPIVATY